VPRHPPAFLVDPTIEKTTSADPTLQESNRSLGPIMTESSNGDRVLLALPHSSLRSIETAPAAKGHASEACSGCLDPNLRKMLDILRHGPTGRTFVEFSLKTNRY
jgi:hypothetical protein